MDSFQQQQQGRRLIGQPIGGDQQQQGPFWYLSSSIPPPPPGGYPPHLPHQHQYPNHPPPPPHPIPHQNQWVQQQQQPPMVMPSSLRPHPPLPPYNSNQPQIPPSYPPPPPHLHQYPPPRPHQLISLPHQHHPLPSAYPPPNQAWGNPSWAQDQGWGYSERDIPYNNEEDWAARAKAWAAAKFVTENHPTQSHFTPLGRMDEHSYAYNDQYQQAVGAPTDIYQSSLPQSNNQQLPIYTMDSQKQVNHLHGSTSFSSVSSSYGTDGRACYNAGDEATITDEDHMASPQKSYAPNSSAYVQEVPYSYSSIPGNREAIGQSESSHIPQPLLLPSVQEGHHSQSTLPVPKISVEQPHFAHDGLSSKFLADASVQPLDFEARLGSDNEPHQKNSYRHAGPAGPVEVTDHDTTAGSIHAWTHIPVGPSGAQFDPSFMSQSSLNVHPTPFFGKNPALSFRPSMPPVSAPFSLGHGTPLHAATFSGDANGGLNVSERPRKSAVPNWLREEIIKKKSVITNTIPTHPTGDSFHSTGSEDVEKSFRRADQADSRKIDSTRSTEDEEDDEDDVEAARSAAINQEIKRVLTEVLLKVTDEFFDEIATKVLNEDELTVEVEETAVLSKHKVSPPPAIPTPKASAKILVPVKVDYNKANGVGENSRPSSPGDILGLANYASDDDEEIRSSRLLISSKMVSASHQQESNDRSSENVLKEVEKGNSLVCIEASGGPRDMDIERKGDVDGAPQKQSARLSERNHMAKNGSTSADNLYYHDKAPEGISVGSGKVNDNPLENANALQLNDTLDGKDSRRPESTSGRPDNEKSITGESRVRESKNNIDTNKNPEKRGERKDFTTEVKADMYNIGRETSDASDSIIHGDRNKLKEKMDKRAKLKERADDSSAKQGATVRESDSRRSSKHDSTKDARRENTKDKREKNKEDGERKRDRTGDKKEDRPTGVTFRHNNRSSPSSARGRNSKDNSFRGHGSASSDEPSDSSKMRKLQSFNSSFSPSPTRSGKRQVSRSPPSKHSHHRHSSYSSLGRRSRRSRSCTPPPIH